MKPLCIIPARGGSKRLARKNVASLGGKPLLAYAVETARDSEVFSKVCVSSEDEGILETARSYGADGALKRPPHLATDEASVADVCLHVMRTTGKEFEAFGVLLATSPLRTARDVREAYAAFQETGEDMLMSVVPFSHPPQRAVRINEQGLLQPFMDKDQMKRTQELETLYRHDGSIYFSKTQAFMEAEHQYGDRIAPYVMPRAHAVDIDNQKDLLWAEFMLKKRHEND